MNRPMNRRTSAIRGACHSRPMTGMLNRTRMPEVYKRAGISPSGRSGCCLRWGKISCNVLRVKARPINEWISIPRKGIGSIVGRARVRPRMMLVRPVRSSPWKLYRIGEKTFGFCWTSASFNSQNPRVSIRPDSAEISVLGTIRKPRTKVIPPERISMPAIRPFEDWVASANRICGKITRSANMWMNARNGNWRRGVSRSIGRATSSPSEARRTEEGMSEPKMAFRSRMILSFFLVRMHHLVLCESGEMADAPDLGSGGGDSVRVQIPPLAPVPSSLDPFRVLFAVFP